MTHFEARLSRGMKGYTLGLLAIIAGAAGYCLLRGIATPGVALLCALGAMPGLFSVRGYDLDGRRLVIERPGRSTVIDLAGLLGAAPAPELVRRSISLWSTRGFFGFVGYGYNKSLGVYRAYVTNSAKAVVLRFRSGKPVVISPDSPDAFLAAVATVPTVPAEPTPVIGGT